MCAALRPCPQGLYHWRGGRIVRSALVAAHGCGRVRDAGAGGGRSGDRSRERRYRSAVAGVRELRPVPRLRRPRGHIPQPGGGPMIASISGKIKAKAALMDPGHYGRSDTSAIARWFWEIDKAVLLLIAVLIGVGLI